MKIFDRFVLIIYSIFVGALSFIIMILPFNIVDFLGVNTVIGFINNIKGNYIYSLTGLIFLILTIAYLISVFKTNTSKGLGSYLIIRNEYGEILIYEETIIGLVDNVASKFTGISNVKTRVNFFEGQVRLSLKGEASNEINIPETSKDLQLRVKEHIENTTGSKVEEVKVEIVSVTTPISRIK